MSEKGPEMTLMEGMTPLIALRDDSLIKPSPAGEPECFSALMDRHLSVIKGSGLVNPIPTTSRRRSFKGLAPSLNISLGVEFPHLDDTNRN